MKLIRSTLVLALALVLGTQVFAGGAKEQPTQPSSPATTAATPAKAKYVFLFIGDGMAVAQAAATEVYANALSQKEPGFLKLGFTQFPAHGLTTTYDSSSIITDSASAGTAMASGKKTLSGVINYDPSKTSTYKTLAEYAKEAGYKVGIVSNVSLDHATPASFYAKAKSRSDMYDIGLQLAKSEFDYFGGGGLAQDKGKKGDQPSVIEAAKANKFTVVNSVADFKALKPGVGKVLAMNPTLQDSFAMPYDIDRAADDLSLADYTAKGIELLDNPQGFFMMVESGKIDWACHANDAAASIGDTLAFDKAIAQAVAFAQKHPADTLIVVTGDHETGGMSIGFAGTQYSTFFDKVSKQKGSYVEFDSSILGPYKQGRTAADAKLAEIMPAAEDFFGISYAALSDADKELLQRAFVRSLKGEVERIQQEDIKLLYGGYEPFIVSLCHIANQASGIGWTTYSHTGVPVATFATGTGCEAFSGYYDNTAIFFKLAASLGLKVSTEPAKVSAK